MLQYYSYMYLLVYVQSLGGGDIKKQNSGVINYVSLNNAYKLTSEMAVTVHTAVSNNCALHFPHTYQIWHTQAVLYFTHPCNNILKAAS